MSETHGRAGPDGPWHHRIRHSRFSRFLVCGAINTLVTYFVYVLLVLIMPYAIAYTVTTVFGIVLSYVLNAKFVFRRKLAFSAAFQYPAVYAVQYFLGLALLYILVEKAHLSEFYAPLVIVTVTVPITFVLSRYVIVQSPKADEGRLAGNPRIDQSEIG